MQNYNPKFKIIPFVFLVIFIFTLFILILTQRDRSTEMGNLDSFAECLTSKGYTMYGAYWCPHCQNEKKAFGESFQYINYIECTKEPKRCTDARVNGYPTWTGSDGVRLEGEQGVEKLAEISGCDIENEKLKK